MHIFCIYITRCIYQKKNEVWSIYLETCMGIKMDCDVPKGIHTIYKEV